MVEGNSLVVEVSVRRERQTGVPVGRQFSGKLIVLISWLWRDVRVVEGNSLENCRAGNGTEGSNPSLSANK